MKKVNLIIPVAADKPEYCNNMPYLFNFSNDGTMLCVKAIKGLDLNRFNNIYITILQKHDELYDIKEIIELQLRRMNLENAKVIILHEPTSSEAETVYYTICKENISGGIFIKDADSFFNCDFTMCNSIAIYPLDQLNLVDPKNKSYVDVDDNFYITNIIEKKIISRFFNAGAYIFESAEVFCTYYKKIEKKSDLYMSHIVYAMLLDKITFRPLFVSNYQDWGNKELYRLGKY